MEIDERVTFGEFGKAGIIVATQGDGLVTVLWDNGKVTVEHISRLWYEEY